MKKKAVLLIVLGLVFFPCASGQDNPLRNAAVLISDADLYCSFFILDEAPTLKIVGAELGTEKTLFADGDRFYIEGRTASGLKEGQMMSVLEVDPGLKLGLGKAGGAGLAFRRGRAKIVRVDKNGILAQAERACDPIGIGDVLVPFAEKEGLLGRDLGLPVRPGEEGTPTGRIIFLDGQFGQIGPGQWALIDMGSAAGLRFGQQLGVFRSAEKGRPAEPIGNAIIIDAGRATATVKILSAKDVVRAGDLVQTR